jgi:glutaredoxin
MPKINAINYPSSLLFTLLLVCCLQTATGQDNTAAGALTEPSFKEIEVSLFITSDCPQCEQMEEYLRNLRVPVTRFFLSPGNNAENEYLERIGRGIVPVTRINGRIIRGYKPDDVRKTILEEKEKLSSSNKSQPSKEDFDFLD